MILSIRFSLGMIIVLLGSVVAWASPTALSYQGRIVNYDGSPLEYGSVSFDFRITSPDGLCVLYREQKDGIDMTSSKGLFDVPIGSGTKSFPASPAITLPEIFSNKAALSCSGGGSFTPQPDDGRVLRVQFHDGVGWRQITPYSTIRSVPYAHYSREAVTSTRLGAYGPSDFLLKGSIPVCSTPGDVLTSTALGVLTCTAGGSGGGVTSVTASTGLSGTATTGAITLSIANGGVGPTQLAGNAVTTVKIQDGNVTGAKLEDVSGLTAGIYGSASAIPTITVDAKGRVTSVTTNSISGLLPAAVGGNSGQYLKSNGASWAAANIGLADVKAIGGGAGFDFSACGADKTISWNSGTDSVTCQDIDSLSADKITSGTLNSSLLPTAIVNGVWKNSGGNVYRDTGSVGVGTATMDAKLHVVGTTGATLKIVDGNQSVGRVLTSDANGVASWADLPASGGGGAVDSVTAGTGLSGTGTTGNLTLSIANGGVTATQIATDAVTTVKILDGNVTGAKLENVVGLTTGSFGSAAAIPEITVDAKGRVTAVTTHSITSLPTAAAGNSGQYLKSNGATWAGDFIRFSDIKNIAGTASAFNVGACSANETVAWSSLLDSFSCQAIGSLSATAITFPMLATTLGSKTAPTYSFAGDPNTGIFSPWANAVAITADGKDALIVEDVGVTIKGQYPLDLNNGNGGIEFSQSGGKGMALNFYPGAAPTVDTAYITHNGGTNEYLTIGVQGENGDEGIFNLQTAGATRLKINGDGRVGIGPFVGVPSPEPTIDAQLHLQGSAGTTLKIVDGNQAAGRVLTSDANGVASWADLPASGGGAVDSVTAGTGLSGTATTGNLTLSIANGGVAAAQLAADAVTTVKILDGNVTGAKLENVAGLTAGIFGSASLIPEITVDAKGRVTAVTTHAIPVMPVAAVGNNGQYLKSNGASWAAANISLADIKAIGGGAAFNLAGCGPNKTISWISGTDSVECQDIGSLAAEKITTGTLDAGRLPASIVDGVWKNASGDVYRDTGKVGIGTGTPSEKLEVSGNIKASGRITGGVGTDTDTTISFANANMIRSSAAGACTTLAVSDTAAGGSFTVTFTGITALCSTITWSGGTVKMPTGYVGGTTVTGVVYTFIDDGATLWVSYVPF